MADRSLARPPADGRFISLDVAEAYRWGFRPDFGCRWCRRPTEIPLGGRGNLCRRCDLAEGQ